MNVYVQRQAMYNLLAAKLKFWKVRGVDDKTLQDCQKISSIASKIIRCYYYLGTITCIFFDLQPFSTGNLPTICYVPKGWFNYLTPVLWYLSWSVLALLLGTDGFFCSLASSLLIQFKLLEYEFRNFVEMEKTAILKNKFKQMVGYHNFLLEYNLLMNIISIIHQFTFSYSVNLNSTFKSVFLVQFMISIASASVSVFIFMQE